MKVIIEVIPHHKQRYETVGDWWEENGVLHIQVSDTGNEYYNHMIAIHEYCEWLQCKRKGVATDEVVTKFDIAFESARPHGNEDEPGDDPKAPYRNEHCVATGIERILCGVLDLSWKDYGDALFNLDRREVVPLESCIDQRPTSGA